MSEKAIRIKLVDDKSQKQIAQTQQSKREKPKEAKFFSNKDNSFERETKSANNGKFQSAAKGTKTALNKEVLQKKRKVKKKSLKDLKFSDLGIKQNEKIKVKKTKKVAQAVKLKKGLENGKKKGIGLGQTNDYLEDIPLGDFTKLNTQEYEFYGFYHRIRQKLEQFWGLNIQEQADKIFQQGRSIASDSNLVTGLTIILDTEGKIVNIIVKSTSGVKELDDAAVESFNQAGPFPNPPKGMLNQGVATIEWGFVVNT